MSLFPSKYRRSFIAQTLRKTHQKFSHHNRVHIIAEQFSSIIKEEFGNKPIRCLDLGCGDMQISELISARLPNVEFVCMDIYTIPDELRKLDRWKKYQSYNGREIPAESNSFDVVMLIDVLHHSGEHQHQIMQECKRIATNILVKDHFEYGFYSRKVLQLMDIIGNWGYGVSIPNRYFTKQSFQGLYKSAGLKASSIQTGINLYQHLSLIKYIANPKWQFIAKLKSTT